MKELEEYLNSKGIAVDTLLINGDALRNWIHNQQDIVQTCIEDLELTEGVRNDFNRGKMAAYEEILEMIDN